MYAVGKKCKNDPLVYDALDDVNVVFCLVTGDKTIGKKANTCAHVWARKKQSQKKGQTPRWQAQRANPGGAGRGGGSREGGAGQ